jgi:hypothetical protein
MRTIIVKIKDTLYLTTLEDLVVVKPPPNMEAYSIETAFKKGRILYFDDGEEDEII